MGEGRRRLAGRLKAKADTKWPAGFDERASTGRSSPSSRKRRQRSRTQVGPIADRQVHPGETGIEGHPTCQASRQADIVTPGHVRSDGASADRTGNSRVPRRYIARSVPQSGRPAARLAALRREMGTQLARCGALRRLDRQRRRSSLSPRLALSRLRHRGFNTDLPYDQFVREQIAGDLLALP